MLVNEVYPVDCLIFKALVNPEQPLYRVSGHENALIVQQSLTAAASSEASLQLKPKKGDTRPPTQTPSRTEDSGQTPSSRRQVAGPTNEHSAERTTTTAQTEGGEQISSDGGIDDSLLAMGSVLKRGAKHPYAGPQNDLDQAIKVRTIGVLFSYTRPKPESQDILQKVYFTSETSPRILLLYLIINADFGILCRRLRQRKTS